jgi:uracil-DNA glycosylase family 4
MTGQPHPGTHPGTPPADCALCPRLAAYRAENAARAPDHHNAPVPPWGDAAARLAIVGLAPGRDGANRTGLPFQGDASGNLLFAVLAEAGLVAGEPPQPQGIFISNAAACAPPGNRPTPAELHACRPFLAAQLAALPGLRAVLALGEIAHQSAIKAIGGKLPKYRFGHGAVHRLPSGIWLVDSYHPSRLNTATGRITAEMLAEALALALGKAA